MISHWLPILTFCPVNGWPDLIFVEVIFQYSDDLPFVELYEARRKIKDALSFQTIYMEDAARVIVAAFPRCISVNVSLMFKRHVVFLENC